MDDTLFKLERLFSLGEWKNLRVTLDKAIIEQEHSEFISTAFEGALRLLETFLIHRLTMLEVNGVDTTEVKSLLLKVKELRANGIDALLGDYEEEE